MIKRFTTSVGVARSLITASWIAVFAGCATPSWPAAHEADVRSVAKERRQEVLRDFEVRRDRAQLQAALARYEDGNVEQCRKTLKELLARNPGHRGAQLTLAETYLEDEPDTARQHAEAALKAHPEDARAEHTLGLALEALGQRNESLGHLKRAHELDAKNETYRMTYEAARTAEVSDLVQPVSAQIVADPNSAAATVEAALAALQADEPEQAEKTLLDAAGRFPHDAAVHRTLGLAQYRSGDYSNAHKSLRRAIDLDKSNALSYFLLGATLRKLGRTDEADAAFGEASARDSRYAAWRNSAQ